MAVEMRDAIGVLTERWRNRGHSLGFGVGIALGYATLGRSDSSSGSNTPRSAASPTSLRGSAMSQGRPDRGQSARLRHGRTLGRRPAARRSASQGVQSSDPGGGDFALAGRERSGGGSGGRAAAKDAVDGGGVWNRHCERKRSNPSRCAKKEWIASVASLLAMTLRHRRRAPSPLVGEGWGEGSTQRAVPMRHPPPWPSPQGGREQKHHQRSRPRTAPV